MIERLDDWQAMNATLGSIRDKSTGIDFKARTRLTKEQLNALYEQNPIAARIVDRPVDDAFRNGWRLDKVVMRDDSEPPDAAALQERLDDLAGEDQTFDTLIKRAVKWSRLFGASAVFLPTEDYDPGAHPVRRKLEQPRGRIARLHPLAVLAAHEILPLQSDDAFGSPTFQRTLSYQLTAASRSPEVHYTRLVTWEPIQLPAGVLHESGQRWGPSVLDRMFDTLGRSGSAQNHAVAQMYISSLLFLLLKGYRQDVKTSDGKTRMLKFLQDFQRSLNSLGVAHIDADDSVQAVTLDTRGSHELIRVLRDEVAAAGDQPREILFNESPSGLNAGELSGPQEIWFQRVAAMQEEDLAPRMAAIMRVAFEAWGLPIRSFEIAWEPLWTKSEETTAASDSARAQTDRTYWEIGALSADEIRKNRFVEQRTALPELGELPADPLVLEPGPEDVEAQRAATATAQSAAPALDAAQSAALMAIVEKVAGGAVPRDAGIELIRVSFPGLAARAEQLLGSAGLVPAAVPGAEPAASTAAPAAPQAPPPSTDAAPSDLMSPREAAERFGLPTRAITLQIDRGALRYWGIGAHKRVSMAEVAELAKRHEQEPEDAPEDDGETEEA